MYFPTFERRMKENKTKKGKARSDFDLVEREPPHHPRQKVRRGCRAVFEDAGVEAAFTGGRPGRFVSLVRREGAGRVALGGLGVELDGPGCVAVDLPDEAGSADVAEGASHEAQAQREQGHVAEVEGGRGRRG